MVPDLLLFWWRDKRGGARDWRWRPEGKLTMSFFSMCFLFVSAGSVRIRKGFYFGKYTLKVLRRFKYVWSKQMIMIIKGLPNQISPYSPWNLKAWSNKVSSSSSCSFVFLFIQWIHLLFTAAVKTRSIFLPCSQTDHRVAKRERERKKTNRQISVTLQVRRFCFATER